MLIKESTFRRILREEARRVLSEQTQTAIVPGRPGAVTQAGYDASVEGVKALIGVAGSVLSGTPGVAKLTANLNDLIAKGKNSGIAGSLNQAASVPLDNNYAPSTGSQKPGIHTLAAILGTLASGSLPGNYAAIALTLVGPQPAPNDNLNNPATLDKVLTPKIQEIVKQTGKTATDLASSITTLASTVPPAAAPAAAAQPAEHTVAEKESISAIAKKYYGVPLSAANAALYTQLAQASGISDANKINVGQKIKLPATLGNYRRIA